MPIVNETPFQRMTPGDDPKKDTFNVHLNVEERTQLNADKLLLQQTKDSTALKQLASIGSKVLHDALSGGISMLILNNIRRNMKTGILQEEGQRRMKVEQNPEDCDINEFERGM